MVLTAAPLAAAGPAHPAEPRAGGLSSLWSWLAGLWGDAGCYIDPYGGCHDSMRSAPRVPEQIDEGCYIDPDGRCRSSMRNTPSVPAENKNGCYIDPSGGGCHG
jgi:hypothetical protein